VVQLAAALVTQSVVPNLAGPVPMLAKMSDAW
jgi:hypothetical protein